MSNFSNFIPQEWLKNSIVKALKEGGTSIVEDVASELSASQLKVFVRILMRVYERKRKEESVIEVKPSEG